LAFITLMVSENQGMKEFGLVAGSGVIFCMLSSLLVLPSMLVIQEKNRSGRIRNIERKISANKDSLDIEKLKNKLIKRQTVKTTSFDFLGTIAQKFANYRIIILALVVVISAFLFYNATQIKFNYDFLSLEPVGLRSIIIQDSMISKYDLSPDMVMVTTNSVEESRELAEKAKSINTVGMVSSISDYIPSPTEYKQKMGSWLPC